MLRLVIVGGNQRECDVFKEFFKRYSGERVTIITTWQHSSAVKRNRQFEESLKVTDSDDSFSLLFGCRAPELVAHVDNVGHAVVHLRHNISWTIPIKKQHYLVDVSLKESEAGWLSLGDFFERIDAHRLKFTDRRIFHKSKMGS